MPHAFQRALTACCCIFKEITMVGSNQHNYLENANACSKRKLKTHVATWLYCLIVLCLFCDNYSFHFSLCKRLLRRSDLTRIDASWWSKQNKEEMLMNPTECVTDLDQRREMIIFESILINFELSIILKGIWGSIKNRLKPKTKPPFAILACPNL